MPESNKMRSDLLARVRLFRTVFVGREDVVPRYWESGNGRSGYSIAHKLSNGHPGYDRSKTDHKIHHALDASAPHTCEYIQNNGFECSKKCGVRAPAALLSRKKNTVGE